MSYAIYKSIPIAVYVFQTEADRDRWLSEDNDREPITHDDAAERTGGEVDEMPYGLMDEVDGVRVCGNWW